VQVTVEGGELKLAIEPPAPRSAGDSPAAEPEALAS
jgi:hypothetical protein